MSHVNVMSTGRSSVALIPGQSIPGVETSFFDPIIEQVGLGPVERNHLSHTIAEVRQRVDSVGPQIQQMLGSLQETTSNLREMSDSIRPAVESTVGHVEDMTRKLNAKSPEFEKIITHVEGASREIEGYLVDNRESIKQTLVSVRDVTGSINPIVARDLPKLEKLLDGAEMSRARADRVLYQADQIAGQVSTMLTHSRSEIERSITNTRDATDWANKLVQKIFTNPLVLTPFYKPNHEDLRVQAVYDMVLVYTKGAAELHDSVKTLEAMSSQPATPQQQNELRQIQQKVQMVSEQMSDLSTRMAEGLKRQTGNGRSERTLR
jgi:phospholipid/cholesterol/gamma-HCH transport system substrate-binding protein